METQETAAGAATLDQQIDAEALRVCPGDDPQARRARELFALLVRARLKERYVPRGADTPLGRMMEAAVSYADQLTEQAKNAYGDDLRRFAFDLAGIQARNILGGTQQC